MQLLAVLYDALAGPPAPWYVATINALFNLVQTVVLAYLAQSAVRSKSSSGRPSTSARDADAPVSSSSGTGRT